MVLVCIITLALLTHGRGGGEGGEGPGDGRENISSYATLLTYSSRLVDSDSLYGGWYWPQAEALAVHVNLQHCRGIGDPIDKQPRLLKNHRKSRMRSRKHAMNSK